MDNYIKKFKMLLSENENLFNNIFNNDESKFDIKKVQDLLEEKDNEIKYLKNDNIKLFEEKNEIQKKYENNIELINEFKNELFKNKKEIEYLKLKLKEKNTDINSNLVNNQNNIKNKDYFLMEKLDKIRNDKSLIESKSNSFISKKNFNLNEKIINPNLKIIVKNKSSIINNNFFNKNDKKLINRKNLNEFICFDKFFEKENNYELFKYIFKDIDNFFNNDDNNNYWIFSFGPQKSGKSYTIQGSKSKPGLLPQIQKYLKKNNLLENLTISVLEFTSGNLIDIIKIISNKLNVDIFQDDESKLYYAESINTVDFKNILKQSIKYSSKYNKDKMKSIMIRLNFTIEDEKRFINLFDLEAIQKDSISILLKELRYILKNKNKKLKTNFGKYIINNYNKNKDKIYFISNMSLSKEYDFFNYFKKL